MKRLLQAAWFLPLFALSVLNNSFVFVLHIFIVALSILGTYELFKMADVRKEVFTLIAAQLVVNSMYIRYYMFNEQSDLGFFNFILERFHFETSSASPTMVAIGVLLAILFTVNLFRKRYTKDIGLAILIAVFSAVYTGFFAWHIIMTRLGLGKLGSLEVIQQHSGQGKYYLFIMLVVIWFMDAGAYYVGKNFGKHKLKESASPNKSIEGVLGGALVAVAVGFVINKLCEAGVFDFFLGDVLTFTTVEYLIFAFVFSFIGFVGDMGESIIKRTFQMKDSSSIVPGMGGVLDVFDSMLFSAPILYYYVYYFTKIGIIHG